MRYNIRICRIISLVVLFFMLMPFAAFAGTIDIDRDSKLTITYRDGDKPLSGAAFDLYLVADVDSDGKRTPAGAFKDYPVNFKSNDQNVWKELAMTLEGQIALRDDTKPVENGQIDADGKLVFGKERPLKPGLYLIIGHRHRQDGRIYTAQPFMVQLPSLDDIGNWDYDVTVNTKHESRPAGGGTSGGGGGGTSSSDISRKVLKVWNDDGNEQERPQSITVYLLRDGEVYDTVTLKQADNWRYEWPKLSNDYHWTVTEQVEGNYTVSVSQEGITYVVTNTYEEEFFDNPTPMGAAETPDEEIIEPGVPLSDKLPQTGQLWWPVAMLIASGMIFVIAGLILRRGENYGAE